MDSIASVNAAIVSAISTEVTKHPPSLLFSSQFFNVFSDDSPLWVTFSLFFRHVFSVLRRAFSVSWSFMSSCSFSTALLRSSFNSFISFLLASIISCRRIFSFSCSFALFCSSSNALILSSFNFSSIISFSLALSIAS